MKNWREQQKAVLFQEWKKLEEWEAFYHYQEIFGREMMCHAQDRLVEIDQEKRRIMQNSKDLDCIERPGRPYQQPFLFSDDE